MERRKVVVALDQRRHRAHHAEGRYIQIPHCLRHRSPVVVDQQRVAVAILLTGEAGQMNLAHCVDAANSM